MSLKNKELEKLELVKRLKKIWLKISDELKKFEVQCPFCSDMMKVTAIKEQDVLQANYITPKNAKMAKRLVLVFNCYSCGFISEFDRDFFEKKVLKSLKLKEKETG
ncbi:MAG: hypothetical protein ACTSRG_02325 [Candidatus Helarchaeota archaeon]